MKMAEQTYNWIARYQKEVVGKDPVISFAALRPKLLKMLGKIGNPQQLDVFHEHERKAGMVSEEYARRNFRELWTNETLARELNWQSFIREETKELIRYHPGPDNLTNNLRYAFKFSRGGYPREDEVKGVKVNPFPR
ncbi:MAG: hypothetical protein K2X38_22395 [Gemmataceae bacterium]|nr:hypothetical protein [Gemmataceae bacterium]